MRKAQEEFINWQGLGCSVMEISHRSKPFIALADAAERNLRELLSYIICRHPHQGNANFCFGNAACFMDTFAHEQPIEVPQL